jgi:hypothetical protein
MANWKDVKLRSAREIRKAYMQLMDLRYYILKYRNRDGIIANEGQEQWDKTLEVLDRIEHKHDREYLQILVKSPEALEEITLRLETMMWMMGGNLELEFNPPGEASSDGPWMPRASYSFINPTGILSRFQSAKTD